MSNHALLAVFLGFLATAPRVHATDPTERLSKWAEIQPSSGIDFVHTDGGNGNYFIVESMTVGLATFDYDDDGLVDLYLLNGSPLPGTPVPYAPPTNRLYKNLGGNRFADVTAEAGVGDTGYSLGVVAADYDNDGDTDLYVSNFGANRFFLNNGDGTFTDGTAWTGTDAGDRFGAGVVFADFDGDGNLDLFAGNYVKFRCEQNIVRIIKGYRFHPGPADYPADTDLLLINDGEGHFRDATEESGIGAIAAATMGAIATDVDNDADLDLVVAVDSDANLLWINDGGVFHEEGLLSGLAFDGSGRANGNMGIDAGDVDGDGWIDLITTTFQDEMPVLYRNLGNGLFEDATKLSRLDSWLHPHVSWGCVLSDFDLDGDLDLFIACGHFMDNIQHIDDRTSVKVANLLMENRGGRFHTVIPDEDGNGLAEIRSSRGVACEDLDGDGDPDLVINNHNDELSLLRNDQTTAHAWLRIRLVGTMSNRGGVGARVAVEHAQHRQWAEVYAGRGYQSHYGGEGLTFGLGRAPQSPLQIDVRWPNGTSESWRIDGANREVVLIEGRGIHGR
ncbi:MAG: hypothetical protein KatS3mg111_0685 [Pirellulaceae bacterium]|nr:MAG: hypothetical protein KatS3mg111_0685 [Pirellulaceae bacterium]